MRNFQTESLTSSYAYLKQCWNDCITAKVKLPINNVVIFDQNENFLAKHKFNYPVPEAAPDSDSEEEEEEEETHLVMEDTEKDWDANTILPPQKKSVMVLEKESESSTNDSIDSLFVYYSDKDDLAIKSKIGKALLTVSGPSKKLTEFEHYSSMAKTFPMEERFIKHLHNQTTSFTHDLKELRRKLRQWTTEWSNQFFVQNLREPVEKDFDLSFSIANGKLRLTEKILRAWNATF